MTDTAARLLLLGPVRCERSDGAPIEFAHETARRVACALAVGGTTPTDRLRTTLGIDANALERAVAEIRRVLGADALVTDHAGLGLGSVDVDVRRFEDLIEEAARRPPAETVALLDEALELWRGPALTPLTDEPWVDAERSRLEAMRDASIDDRADALVRIGKIGQAIEALGQLEQPFDDRRTGILMTALALDGRHPQALDVYRAHRAHLAAAGTEPSPTLRSIERRIVSELELVPDDRRAVRPTGEITVVFTDIEGSTRLWADRPLEMERNLERHDEIVRSLVAEHLGYVFSTAGDSFGVAFQDADQAAQFAIELQRRIETEPWPESSRIRVRIGLHRGSTSERSGNYFGSTLNVAARVEEAAHGGQVLASDDVARALSDRLPVRDLGEHLLRSLSDPVRLVQLDVPDAANDHPAPRSVSPSISNIPAQRGELRGRSRATVEIRELLARHRMVSLTGAGGIGKTRLAVHVAGEESLGSRDAVLFVDLATEAVDVDAGFLAALGLSPTAEEDTVQQLEQVLLGRRTLLVVDNCEHVLDQVVPLLDRLLDRVPELTVLATSREPLGIVGERVWRVPPLSTRADGPAVRLFEERASEVDPDFRLDESNVGDVIEVCRRLDGLPLAIELAASRKHSMTVEDIRSRLDDRFRLLRTSARGRSPRQQTIEAVVEWSDELCSEPERELLRRLVVFPSSFARDDVAGVTGFDPSDASDLLDALVSKSLVQVVRLPGDRMRYRLLETIRDYGLSRQPDPASLSEARDRHLAHFLTAEGAPDELRAIDVNRRIQVPEYENIRAAAEWALERGDPLAATRLTIGRTLTIVERGGGGRVVDWLSGRDRLGTNDRLWALNGCAYAAMARGDHEDVEAYTDEAVALAAGEPYDALPNLFVFSAFDQVIDDPERALETVDRALDIAPRTPSGAFHMPTVHYARSRILLHNRRLEEALDETLLASDVAGPRHPVGSMAQAGRLVVLQAKDDVDGFASLRASVQRPVPWGAQEWLYRLLDLLDMAAWSDGVADLALSALSLSGGHPVRQARDLLSVLAFRQLRDGDRFAAERLATAGLSGSDIGALAFETIARIRGVGEGGWTAHHRQLGRSVRSAPSRERAMALVRGLAAGHDTASILDGSSPLFN